MADISKAGRAPGPSRSLDLWAPPTPGHGVIGAEAAAAAELLQLAVRIRASGAAPGSARLLASALRFFQNNGGISRAVKEEKQFRAFS